MSLSFFQIFPPIATLVLFYAPAYFNPLSSWYMSVGPGRGHIKLKSYYACSYSGRHLPAASLAVRATTKIKPATCMLD